jgi:hypothetical protein
MDGTVSRRAGGCVSSGACIGSRMGVARCRSARVDDRGPQLGAGSYRFGGSVLKSIARFELCLLVLCVMAISACDDVAGVDSDAQRADVRTRAGPDRSASSLTVGCSAAITSRVDPKWRSRSVVRGPLGLWGDSLDIGEGDRWGRSAFWTKVPVIVAGQRPVTLRVAARDRARVGLTYGPRPASPASSRNGARGLATAPRAVRFVPCLRQSVTAWPGGLALADRRPRARFEVRAQGQGWRSLSIPERG